MNYKQIGFPENIYKIIGMPDNISKEQKEKYFNEFCNDIIKKHDYGQKYIDCIIARYRDFMTYKEISEKVYPANVGIERIRQVVLKCERMLMYRVKHTNY